MNPTVSVIVPNYNHGAFLQQRLDSILQQTYQDYELFILDDCSSDNSRDIIQQYAQRYPHVQTFFNQHNSGSPFAQWNKGVALARGKYVWIAESDDYSDPRFLEVVVEKLEQYPTVDVVYAQSWVVNAQGEVIDSMKRWTDSLDIQRWAKDYQNSGTDENRKYLFHKPSIPNTSAVVFTKERYEAVGGADASFVMCGDWLHWIKMVESTSVYFVAEPLNYFRRHEATTRHILTHDRVLVRIREEYRILGYILTYLHPSQALRNKLLRDYFERSFNFCPARLKFSAQFLDFIAIVKKVDRSAYYRLILSIFKRFITYLPSKLGSRSVNPPKLDDEFEKKLTH